MIMNKFSSKKIGTIYLGRHHISSRSGHMVFQNSVSQRQDCLQYIGFASTFVRLVWNCVMSLGCTEFRDSCALLLAYNENTHSTQQHRRSSVGWNRHYNKPITPFMIFSNNGNDRFFKLLERFGCWQVAGWLFPTWWVCVSTSYHAVCHYGRQLARMQ